MLKLAHISDPHLPLPAAIDWRDLMNKRVTGYLSWKRHRRSVHDQRVLDALKDGLDSVAPNHLVVTGDITNLALPAEFEHATNWLADLGQPGDVSIIPGNHDAYIDVPWDKAFGRLSAYMAQNAPNLKTASTSFPYLRKIDRTAIIGLSTALPTRWFSAAGALGQPQLNKLRHMLESLGDEGLFRVVLIHHPPINESERMRKQLRDAAAFRRVVAETGVELVLHGHNHRFDQGFVDTPAGPAPVIGVPSASALPKHGYKAAAFHLYRITPIPEGWQIQMDVHRYDQQSRRFAKAESQQFSVAASMLAASAA